MRFDSWKDLLEFFPNEPLLQEASVLWDRDFPNIEIMEINLGNWTHSGLNLYIVDGKNGYLCLDFVVNTMGEMRWIRSYEYTAEDIRVCFNHFNNGSTQKRWERFVQSKIKDANPTTPD